MCGLPASNEKQSRPSELIVLQLTLKICFENICIVFLNFKIRLIKKMGLGLLNNILYVLNGSF